MKKLILLTGVLLGLPLLVSGQRTDDRTASRIESRVTARTDAFYWGNGSAGFTPSQVPALIVEDVSYGSITIAWDDLAPEDVSIYLVYRGTATGPTVIEGDSINLSYIDTNVVAGSTYYYQVSAVSSDGLEGPKSNEVSATAIYAPPPPVLTLADADAYYLAGYNVVDVYDDEQWVDQVGGSAPDHDSDMSAGSLTGNMYWEPRGEGSFAKLPGPIVTEQDFSSTGSWLGTGAYWSITGGEAVYSDTGNTRDIWQTSSGDTVPRRYDIYYYEVDVIATGASVQMGVSSTFSPGLGVGSHEGVLFLNAFSGTNYSVRATTSATVDNVYFQRMLNYPGDYWRLNQVINNIDELDDNANLNLAATDDFAFTIHASSVDWSNGNTCVFSNMQAGDASFWFGFDTSGQPRMGGSEDGTATTYVSLTESIYTTLSNSGTTVRDGAWYPWHIRWEFDYDDGAGQSRYRVGYSIDRGQRHDWVYAPWANFGTGLFDFHNSSGHLQIGHREGNEDWQGNLFQMLLYDERDEYFDDPNRTFLYEFHPQEHEIDGTSPFHDSTLQYTTTNDNVEFPMLVTRPQGFMSEGFTLNHWIPATNVFTDWEDRSVVLYGIRHVNHPVDFVGEQIISDDSAGSGGSVELTNASGGSTAGEFSDGTNTLTTSSASFDFHDPIVMGIAVDATNVYIHADGNTVTTARNTAAPGTLGSLDWTTDRDLQLWFDHGNLYAIGLFPDVFDTDAAWDGAPAMFEAVLRGRRGIDDAIEFESTFSGSGGGASDGSILTDPGAYDTWLFSFQNNASVSEAQFEVEEIELFASTDGTGTNIAEQADTDEATRNQYPFARGYPANISQNTPGTLFEGNYMIDGSTGTTFQSATEYAPGFPVGTVYSFIEVNLENKTKVRSLSIKFASGGVPDGLLAYIYGKNRDGSNGTSLFKVVTLADVTTLQTFQNVQP